MKKITTCLWFDDQAEQAVELYTSLFKNAKAGSISRYSEENASIAGKEPGSTMTISFNIEGREFLALNGGPIYRMTPAISLAVGCSSEAEMEHIYKKLADGGEILMELNRYPFSEKFAWLNDKFGVSWQLNLVAQAQKITPFLMFVGAMNGRAAEAVEFYTTLFENSGVIKMERYPEDGTSSGATVKVATFDLNGQNFMAMDSPIPHSFSFTPGTSFICLCQTQAEIDRLWQSLSEGGKPSQCGWLTDKFGVSWQIVPEILIDKITEPSTARQTTKELLQMSKIEIEKLS